MNLWIYGAGQDRERKKINSTRTTRYVTLLSVVLALALTAALAACGSDEPSGVTGPDRTASTPAATAPPAASGSAETDREALVALYNATDGENWENSDNWLSGAPLGEWEGVYTNDDGRVTALVLWDDALSGVIPPELGNLPNLNRLSLNCQLSGEIPPELSNLERLTSLNLAENQLTGEIPPELWKMWALYGLNLAGNQLTGEIPPELWKMHGLYELNLAGNQLSGGLPSGLATNLAELNLSENQLTGEIPPELGNYETLISLNLSKNQLTGEIPSELGNLENLSRLQLGNNQLTGKIPSELCDSLDINSTFFDHNKNEIEGQYIPPDCRGS